ncbi:MAG: hypothetical protein AB7V32_10425 [Candidatus Berkiella sp.]
MMLHGPADLQGYFIDRVNETIKGGINQKNSASIEARIIAELANSIADNSRINRDKPLPLDQKVDFEQKETSLLDLAKQHQWNNLLTKIKEFSDAKQLCLKTIQSVISPSVVVPDLKPQKVRRKQ